MLRLSISAGVLLAPLSAFSASYCETNIPSSIDILEISNPSIEILGSGNIYSNGIMQGVVSTSYEATNDFSLGKVTLCDRHSLAPISKEWVVDNQDNGYAHTIEQLQVTPIIKSETSENIPDSLFNKFSVTRFLKTEALSSVDLCVAISGTQRIEQHNGIMSEIPVTISSCDNPESAIITSVPQVSIEATNFSVSKKTISSNKHHDYVRYTLSSTGQLWVPKSSIKFTRGGFNTSSVLTVRSDNASLVLRDRQLGDKDLSWAGVWAVNPEVTSTFKFINEESYSIGQLAIPYLDNPYSVVEFVGVQMHKEHVYYKDGLLSPSKGGGGGGGPIGPASNGYSGVDYNTNAVNYNPLPGESDYLESVVSFNDYWGASYQVPFRFTSNAENLEIY